MHSRDTEKCSRNCDHGNHCQVSESLPEVTVQPAYTVFHESGWVAGQVLIKPYSDAPAGMFLMDPRDDSSSCGDSMLNISKGVLLRIDCLGSARMIIIKHPDLHTPHSDGWRTVFVPKS